MHVASHQVLKSSFRDDDETCAKATIGMEKAAYYQCKQVLGGNWNYFGDWLMLPLKPLAQLARKLPPTKWSICKVVAKIFDPMGIISPVTFQIKVLFQELCNQKIDWDDPVPTGIKEDWASWCIELTRIEHVKISKSLNSWGWTTSRQFYRADTREQFSDQFYLCYMSMNSHPKFRPRLNCIQMTTKFLEKSPTLLNTRTPFSLTCSASRVGLIPGD